MLTITDIKNDEEVKAIMYMSEKQIEALGFTEHSVRHSSIVSKWSGELLRGIGAKAKSEEIEHSNQDLDERKKDLEAKKSELEE